MSSARQEGADILVVRCGSLRTGESVLIVCDPTTRSVADLLLQSALSHGGRAKLLEIPPAGMHGQEPPLETANAMAEADLVLGVTSKSMAHTSARIRAAKQGTRYLSLPDFSLELLEDDSLRADFAQRARLTRWMADRFTAGSQVHVKTERGTSIRMGITGRIGNFCPGFVSKAGDLGSPPDIEANVSPLEDSAEGIVVVDGSIPYPTLGKLSEPVTLHVKNGRITRIEGPEKIRRETEKLFAAAGSPKSYVLAECGVGLNDKARLTGVMLTDEGTAGTMHFGFGSNATVGGVNDVPFHLDFVFRSPTLTVDGEILLDHGQVVAAEAI